MVKKRHQFALVGSNSGLKNVSLTHLIGRTVDYMHKENTPAPPPLKKWRTKKLRFQHISS